nr:hypothetical protein [Tanacetum cinerariifolium]
MFDCDNYYSSESDNDSWSPRNLYDRFIPSGGYHAIPPPMTGTFMPPKPNLVFHTPPLDENEHLSFNVQLSPTKTKQDLPSTLSAPIIEDWVSDSEEEDIPQVLKDVPSLAQSLELVKTPRHSGSISPLPMSVAPPVPLRSHSSSKGLKRPKKTYFVCKSESHLIKDCNFHARKLAQNSCAPRDIYKHNAPMKHSRIPLHKVFAATPKSKPVLFAAARTIGAARPTFSKTRPHIALYTVPKSKAPTRRPFIRHTTPNPRLTLSKVNTANPSAVSAARVKAARPFVMRMNTLLSMFNSVQLSLNKTYLLHPVPPSLRIGFLTLRRKIYLRHTSPKPSISPPRVNAAKPSAVSAARVNAAKLSAASAARINAVKPSAVTAV